MANLGYVVGGSSGGAGAGLSSSDWLVANGGPGSVRAINGLNGPSRVAQVLQVQGGNGGPGRPGGRSGRGGDGDGGSGLGSWDQVEFQAKGADDAKKGSPSQETILTLFWDHARGHSGRQQDIALVERALDASGARTGKWTETTWEQYGKMVTLMAGGMRRLGFEKGDRSLVLSANSVAWLCADLATMCLGGQNAGAYLNDTAEQVSFLCSNFEPSFVFVDTPAQLDKILPRIRSFPKLKYVVLLIPSSSGPTGWQKSKKVLCLDQLLQAGEPEFNETPKRVELEARCIPRSEFAMCVYTSGTTGRPKGACYSHTNLIYTGRELHRQMGKTTGDVHISFLPLCHIAERMQALLLPMCSRGTIWFTDIPRLQETMLQARPTVLMCVPRLWEKLHAGLEKKFSEAEEPSRSMLRMSMRVGRQLNTQRANGSAFVSPALALQWGILARLVVRKVLMAMGLERCHTYASGSAPLSGAVGEFFASLGIFIREVYGQSETCGLIASTSGRQFIPGIVGPAVHGVEIKLGEGDEILCRGDNIFMGYFRNADATKQTVDRDGWLRTGDAGEFTATGSLRITDRLKDLIKTSGGKYVAPQKIESVLKLCPGISQAIVVGDRMPYCVVLLSLDETDLRSLCRKAQIDWNPKLSVADLRKSPAVLQLLSEYLQEVNTSLARYEQLKAFRILDKDLSVDDGTITPTLKVKRRNVVSKYIHLVQEMYPKIPIKP